MSSRIVETDSSVFELAGGEVRPGDTVPTFKVRALAGRGPTLAEVVTAVQAAADSLAPCPLYLDNDAHGDKTSPVRSDQ